MSGNTKKTIVTSLISLSAGVLITILAAGWAYAKKPIVNEKINEEQTKEIQLIQRDYLKIQQYELDNARKDGDIQEMKAMLRLSLQKQGIVWDYDKYKTNNN